LPDLVGTHDSERDSESDAGADSDADSLRRSFPVPARSSLAGAPRRPPILLTAEPATSHQVSIPLDDYEQLRKQSERPALTVIDLLRLEGSFAKRDLAVTFTGRASGSWPTAEVLSSDGVRLHSCEGDAMLSRAESGAFAVTPLAQRFRLRCKVALDGSDRLEAQATGAVLEVVSSVSDGELVASGDGTARDFSVVRRISGSEQLDLPPTVTGLPASPRSAARCFRPTGPGRCSPSWWPRRSHPPSRPRHC